MASSLSFASFLLRRKSEGRGSGLNTCAAEIVEAPRGLLRLEKKRLAARPRKGNGSHCRGRRRSA